MNEELVNTATELYKELINAMKPKLSIVVCCSEEDKKYLPELERSLPTSQNIEVIYCWAKKTGEAGLITNQNRRKEVNYVYDKFSFAEMRNFANRFAYGDWIMHLDADERLLVCNTEDFTNQLQDVPENIGGFYVSVISVFPPTKEYFAGLENAVPIVRLYRKGFVYEGRCHEQISRDIERKGFDIAIAPMYFPRILHVGYYEPKKEKILRNIKLLCGDVYDEETFDEYKLFQLWKHINQLDRLGLIKRSPYGLY